VVSIRKEGSANSGISGGKKVNTPGSTATPKESPPVLYTRTKDTGRLINCRKQTCQDILPTLAIEKVEENACG